MGRKKGGRRFKPPTDPAILALVGRVGKGDIAAAGVLADYLEEHRLPHAARVRWLWDRYQRRVVLWKGYDFPPRGKWMRWEAVAAEGRSLCRLTLRRFGVYYWTAPPLKTFVV